MTASKCATCMSWLRLEEGGRGKRKWPHIDQYEEGITQGAIDESDYRKIGRPQVLYQELAPARSIGYRGMR
jgi:hypothetical protein